jgi:hypothetical protein
LIWRQAARLVAIRACRIAIAWRMFGTAFAL